MEREAAIATDRLKKIAKNARRFSWADGEEYKGPVHPQGILTIPPRTKAKYWFVLCEHVPHEYLLDCLWDEVSPEGIIMAALKDSFELLRWDDAAQELGEIHGLSSPASVAALCAPPSRWRSLEEG